MSYYSDVSDFHRKFFPETVPWDPRLVEASLLHVREEVDELVKAVDDCNAVEALDAIVDLVYVALGLAYRLGLDEFDRAWDEVHQANMAKIKGPGRRGQFDVVKPPWWVPPDLSKFVAGQNGGRRWNSS